MYSRFPRNTNTPIRLPDHYSGCAFSETDNTKAVHSEPPQIHFSSEETKNISPHSDNRCAFPSSFGKSVTQFLGGMQFEELLLIGLIILLARSEQDSDIVLWLALLLFCR